VSRLAFPRARVGIIRVALRQEYRFNVRAWLEGERFMVLKIGIGIPRRQEYRFHVRPWLEVDGVKDLRFMVLKISGLEGGFEVYGVKDFWARGFLV